MKPVPSNADGAKESDRRTSKPAKHHAAAQLRIVSERVVALADAMQRHFQQQDAHAAEVAGALGRVGNVLEQLAQTQQAQGACLQTLAAQSESTGKHVAALSDTAGRIPESLLTQAEAIRTVARQIEVGQETDTQLVQSLQTFGRAVDALGAAGATQVETLQRGHDRAVKQLRQRLLELEYGVEGSALKPPLTLMPGQPRIETDIFPQLQHQCLKYGMIGRAGRVAPARLIVSWFPR